MLIPMADVPRWYAERKPKDTIAIRHGADTLTWEQFERGANRRARAFAAKGVKPGDFVAIGLPNGNAFFETSFAVWKLGATYDFGRGFNAGAYWKATDGNPAFWTFKGKNWSKDRAVAFVSYSF